MRVHAALREYDTAITVLESANHLVISEFMADNESTLQDEDGAFSDWIEIHNPTAEPVGLLGYYLTDDRNDLNQWAFPDAAIAPGEHRIVFASGKNRSDPSAPLHTNFRLAKSGEYLGLVGPGWAVVHEFTPEYPSQESDISYGIVGGDVSFPRFMGVPTPGATNDPTPPAPAPVRFSHPSGTFTTPFALTLSVATPDAEIRCTLDGTDPSPTNGAIYSGPIAIGSTTRIRAAAISAGQAGRLTTASYLKLATDLQGYTSTLPILVIENFGRGTIPQKGWSTTGSGIKQVPRQPAVWAAFDRIGGVSALTNTPQMLSDIGIRGRGAFSSTWRQKPYSVEAIDAAGEEQNVSPLGLPAHADWTLYFPDPDSNKDPTLLFNAFAYELSRNFGNYSVRFRWVEAFINEDGGDLRLADRRGVYAIMEKVSRGQDRLDFERLSADGTRGGWLLNLNRMDPQPEAGWPAPNGATQPWFFHTAGPDRIQQTPRNVPRIGDDEPQQSNGFLNFDNPNGYTINLTQRDAIENWFKEFEDVLWNNAVWRDPVNGYRKYLDERDFVDYFILNVLTRNGDGLLISMFPWKGDDGKLRMGPAWDYNWSAYYISGANATGALMHRSDRLWYRRLFADPDFRQLYIDRWWELRRGPMSNAAMDAVIDTQVAEISPAKAVLNGFASAAHWTQQITQMKTWLKTRADWIDSNYLRPPLFVASEPVAEELEVTITGTNGPVYFTTDGSDPRAAGGGVGTSARVHQTPLTFTEPALLRARVRIGTNWSGVTSEVFPPQDLTKLIVTEIMFHPPASGSESGDAFEFLELRNISAHSLILDGLTFTAGIHFTFSTGTRLQPGEFFVLARNSAALQTRYPGVTVHGVYSGRLDNRGETLRLTGPAGRTVFELTYRDRAPWPSGADGTGLSWQRRLMLAEDDPTGWVAASPSPGAEWRPVESPSAVTLDRITVEMGAATLRFNAAANRSYSVQFKDSLSSVAWLNLTNVLSQATNHVPSVSDVISTRGSRFYRVVTPQQP